MEKDKAYLRHILDAISNLEGFLKNKDYPAFIKDKLLQDGVVREIEIIGEASKRISTKFKSSVKEIPWEDIAGMRDRLVHDYFSVDLGVVWETINKDIPKLKNALLDKI